MSPDAGGTVAIPHSHRDPRLAERASVSTTRTSLRPSAVRFSDSPSQVQPNMMPGLRAGRPCPQAEESVSAGAPTVSAGPRSNDPGDCLRSGPAPAAIATRLTPLPACPRISFLPSPTELE